MRGGPAFGRVPPRSGGGKYDAVVQPSTDLAVSALATRRLVRLVVEDEITRPMRLAAAGKGPLEYLVGCPSCVSVWAALAVILLPRTARYALASSEAAIMLSKATKMAERFGL